MKVVASEKRKEPLFGRRYRKRLPCFLEVRFSGYFLCVSLRGGCLHQTWDCNHVWDFTLAHLNECSLCVIRVIKMYGVIFFATGGCERWRNAAFHSFHFIYSKVSTTIRTQRFGPGDLRQLTDSNYKSSSEWKRKKCNRKH